MIVHISKLMKLVEHSLISDLQDIIQFFLL